MKMERFAFKELGHSEENRSPAPIKIFTPSGRVKESLPPPPPPPPTFSEAELKTAERDGFQKGFIEGMADGKRQAENLQAANEAALLAMLAQFTQSLIPLFDDYRKLALQVREDMPKVAFAVARKVAGSSLAENASAVVNDITVRCCESLITEPKITITVHESLGDALEKRLQEVAARLPAATDIIIQRSPELPLSDCRVEWKNGFMERSVEQLLGQLEGVIEDMSATAVRDGAEDIQALHDRMNAPPPTDTPTDNTTQKE